MYTHTHTHIVGRTKTQQYNFILCILTIQADRIDYDYLNIEQLAADDERIKQSRYEGTLHDYNSTYEDYLEMYIQFGYVVLFASISPLAAVFALVNNFIEIRIDAYKLCCAFKRPFAKRAKNTGAWLLAFETLLVMSIITNCGLLYMQPEIKYVQHALLTLLLRLSQH